MDTKQRTLKQNKSLHKFYQLLSDELNVSGLDMKVVLKPSYQIWWTPESVKEHLWKPLQEAMYQTESTKDLTTAQVDKVFEQLAKILGEKYHLELTFPSINDAINYEETER